MPRGRTGYNKISTPDKETTGVLMRVKQHDAPVRIRAGAGVSFQHYPGQYLGKGIHDIDEISDGPGSEKGWGHLADGAGWVALDFVDVVK